MGVRLRARYANNLLMNSQGILGSFLIRLNARIAVYRRNSVLNNWPTLEVVCVSAVTAAVCYLVCEALWT